MDGPLLFGKYCLLERISVGGMAEVFRGKPLNAPDPDHYFAVKRILPHLAEDVEFIKMFVDEARLTVQLDHANIVQTYELGQFQSSHYIVMEFVAGKDLLAFQKYVRNQGTILGVDMACHIVREVAKGLDYAHNKTDENGDHLGIIHRDVSPQNVLVSWDGRVRVIDFGIAKATSQSTKTKAGVMKGKFGYMSPEQVKGQGIDHRSDIFAMGTLLWELLTNRRLFKAGNQLEAMTMIGDPEVAPPSTVNPEVPPKVDEICMKMLAENPDDRYHWGADLAEDIEAFLSSQRPPFHGSQLTTWIRGAFRDDFEQEKQKRDDFRSINTADDVRRRSEETYGPGGKDGDQNGEDATGVWDVDEAPDSDADLEHFVSDHTVVQAGGLDLDDYDEWDDAPDTIDETEEVVESRIENATEEALPRAQVKVAAESRYEAEKTAITNPETSSSDAPSPTPVNQSASGPSSTSEATANVEPASIPSAPTPAQPAGGGDASFTGQPKAPASTDGDGPSVDRRKLALAATAIVSLLVLGAAVAWVAVGEEESDEAMETGEILVEVEPVSSQLEIYVDGRWVGDESPFGLRGLETGTYTVEIDHRDYPHWRQEVSVGGGEVALVESDLVADGQLVVEWDETPEQMALFVDGEAVPIDGDQQRVEMALRRGTHLVEAFGGDHQLFRERLDIEAESDHHLQVEWTPAGRLTLRGQEDRQIRLDGDVWAEELPVTLTELKLAHVYDLEIGDEQVILGYPELGWSEINVDELSQFERRRRDDFGQMVVEIDGDDPWHLIIDEVETGLVTPLDDLDPIPVAAGDRMIGFQRGDQRHEYEVRIVEGERTLFRPSLEP